MMDSMDRFCTKFFRVAAPLLAVVLALYALSRGGVMGLVGETFFYWVAGTLMMVVMLCSGFTTWHEFRENPLEESERGEWTGRQLFHTVVFVLTFFVTFLYLPALFFR